MSYISGHSCHTVISLCHHFGNSLIFSLLSYILLFQGLFPHFGGLHPEIFAWKINVWYLTHLKIFLIFFCIEWYLGKYRIPGWKLLYFSVLKITFHCLFLLVLLLEEVYFDQILLLIVSYSDLWSFVHNLFYSRPPHLRKPINALFVPIVPKFHYNGYCCGEYMYI